VGDYRVIYEITDEIRIVRVNRVRHRGKYIGEVVSSALADYKTHNLTPIYS
jgi:hypothetical protein